MTSIAVKTCWKQGSLSQKYSESCHLGGDGGDDFYIIQKINPYFLCTACKVI